MKKRRGREGDYGNSPRQDGLRKIGFRPRGSVRGTGAGNAAAVIGNFGGSGRNGKKECRDHRKDRPRVDRPIRRKERSRADRPTHRKGKPYSHKSARRACAVGRKRRGEARFRWSARARRSAPFRAVRAGRPRFFPHRRLTSVEKAAFPYLPYFPHSPYLPCRRIESQDPQNGSWYNPLIRKEGEGWIG